jgi:5-formyltetrahydrofolate cyclo-ligase
MRILSKNTLRKHYLEVRQVLSADYIEHSARLITSAVLDVASTLEGVKNIGLYLPIKNEVPTDMLIRDLHTRNYGVYIPIVSHKQMSFHEYMPPFNTNTMNKDVATIPDVLVVPLVACDQHGNRLGYGKGYYDRFTDSTRTMGHTLVTIGICYSVQCVPFIIPTEPHDQKLDYIITEKVVQENRC